MRINYNLILSVLAGFQLTAQTFNGSGGSISNNGIPTHFPLQVTGLLSNLGAATGLSEICVSITHPDMNEITVSLISPSGIFVELVNSTGLKGSNFSSTCFNSGGGTSITNGSAPYSGSFKPTGYIGRFNNGSSGNGQWQLVVKDFNNNLNSGNVVSWSLNFTSSAPQPVTINSSNLPLVFINTNAQALSTESIVCDFGMVDNGTARNNVTDPRNMYSGPARIHWRGSSSLIFEKKSLKIDLMDASGAPVDATLGRLPGESDWVLTPAYSDKTLMRNALAHQLFRDMGHYSPRTRFVEVFINNEYFGVYTLVEKPKRNIERVDIYNMSEMDNSYPLITGGYLFQINRAQNHEGWPSLYPGNTAAGTKFFYQQEFPRPNKITPQQQQYIKAYMDTFETVMESPNFADPNTGYRKYMDVRSFADFLLLNELAKNVDGYKLSTFMYKDNILDGGKLHMGPMWDFDLAFNNANYGNANSELWWQYDQQIDDNPIPKWWVKLMSDTYFKDVVWCRWNTMRMTGFQLSKINAFIDEQAALLAEAQSRNFQQFPILDAYVFPNPPGQISNSYQSTVDDMKAFIAKRATWMDQNIFGYCVDVAVESHVNDGSDLTIFPNPSTGKVQVNCMLTKPSTVSAEVLDVTGRTIQHMQAVAADSGEHRTSFDLSGFPAGTYIVKVKINGNSHYKKLIKTEI